ncbi:MAG: sensor histidine kinase [Stenomitos frigidus ULC029]
MNTSETSVILVVDDNPTNLEVLSETLMASGFEVGVATSGEGALQQIAYTPPDLVLLDVMMPGIDGFETCRRLKADSALQAIPVIFMTALSDPVDKVKGLALGAVDYITKPFQQEEVLARVKVQLQLRQLTKVLEQQNVQLKQLTENLEQKVEERSLALQQAQLQLVQTEKLSSLGQLVAGVAHEINNPVGCIASNVAPAKEYVADITRLVRLYQQYYPNPLPAIAAEAEAIDLEFALEDLPKILNSMASGATRIRDISVSLRNFSRSDTATPVLADLHDGLDSTLLILHHRLKAEGSRPEIKVMKQYGDIPLIECYPGQLNQVFMNILGNAIEALEEGLINAVPLLDSHQISETASFNGAPCHLKPMIQIQTEMVSPHSVRICIADNGPGIPASVQHRLFDPFFTTKSVGKGTGLGMSISRQIITEKHQGNIHCLSEPGKGAEFIIDLPTQQTLLNP